MYLRIGNHNILEVQATEQTKDMDKYFSKEDIHIRQIFEKCSPSLHTRGMQAKDTMRHPHSVKVTVIKKTKDKH